MPFVVDRSVTGCCLMPDELHPIASAAYRRLVTDAAIVPSLWWFEMRNMLVVNERRGRLVTEQSDRALDILKRLPIQIDRTPGANLILSLSRRHRLTVYDAAYLDLAVRQSVPLATLDDALSTAARKEDVALLEGSDEPDADKAAIDDL
ncbi:MAG: type II toxin-antitoxin system VapC family toxin [Rhizobiaceae bacterium]|nr:type II toxin-antitoxin system VapC family toxin [Rhizobiaceae bacterium]